MTVTVEFGGNETYIGEKATRAQYDAFRDNVAEAVASIFGVTVHQVLASSEHMARCYENPEIDEWLRTLGRGDGWIEYLPEDAAEEVAA